MIRYQELSESKSSDAVRDIRERYGMPVTQTAWSGEAVSFFSQSNVAPVRRDEDSALAPVQTSVARYFYYDLLQELKAKAAEWQRAEEERWEKLEMEIGVERDIVLKTPNIPKRRITATLRYRGRLKPKLYYDPVGDE